MKLMRSWLFFIVALILLVGTIPGNFAGTGMGWLYSHVLPEPVFTSRNWETVTESQTPTVTQLSAQTTLATPTLTTISTLTGQAPATDTLLANLPTHTLTLTPSPTTTATPTSTTTLEPVSVPELIFPAFSPTADQGTGTSTRPVSPTAISTRYTTESLPSEIRSQPLIITLISLWVGLALFLFLSMRALKGDAGKKQ